MDATERARKQLDSIAYVHPGETKSQQNPYKAYNPKGDNLYSTKSGKDPYGRVDLSNYSYNDDDEKNRKELSFSAPIASLAVNPFKRCPVKDCGLPSFLVCDCTEYKDISCKNGHTWYVLPANKTDSGKEEVVIGDPHRDE